MIGNSLPAPAGTRVSPFRPGRRRWASALRLAAFLTALYGFLLSIALMEAGFRGFGEGFSRALISATANPFIGLMIGLLATSIAQSSSFTTSVIVGLVASGKLPVAGAIPMVMGANIGTTVTNTLVSLGHIGRKEEFRRAFAAATVHGFFNLLTVAILLPVELATSYLETAAGFLSRHLAGLTPGAALGSPLKPLFRPLVDMAEGALAPLGATGAGAAMLAAATVVLFGCLLAMVHLLRVATAGKAEAALDRTLGRSAWLGLAAGLVLTAVIQSSSVVTSMLVPLAGAGVLRLDHAYAITLGANVGTTVTAILAALAAGPEGLTIAFVHLLFNATGVVVFFPIPTMRKVRVYLASRLAGLTTESSRYALVYVVGVFFLAPGACVLVWRLAG